MAADSLPFPDSSDCRLSRVLLKCTTRRRHLGMTITSPCQKHRVCPCEEQKSNPLISPVSVFYHASKFPSLSLKRKRVDAAEARNNISLAHSMLPKNKKKITNKHYIRQRRRPSLRASHGRPQHYVSVPFPLSQSPFLLPNPISPSFSLSL